MMSEQDSYDDYDDYDRSPVERSISGVTHADAGDRLPPPPPEPPLIAEGDAIEMAESCLDQLSMLFRAPIPILMVITVALASGANDVDIADIKIPSWAAEVLSRVIILVLFIQAARLIMTIAGLLKQWPDSEGLRAKILFYPALLNPFAADPINLLPKDDSRSILRFLLFLRGLASQIGVGGVIGFAALFQPDWVRRIGILHQQQLAWFLKVTGLDPTRAEQIRRTIGESWRPSIPNGWVSVYELTNVLTFVSAIGIVATLGIVIVELNLGRRTPTLNREVIGLAVGLLIGVVSGYWVAGSLPARDLMAHAW